MFVVLHVGRHGMGSCEVLDRHRTAPTNDLKALRSLAEASEVL